MQRRPSTPELPSEFVRDRLLALLESGLPVEEQLRHVERLRAALPGDTLDRQLLERIGQLHGGLQSAQQKQSELRELVDRLTAPPFFPAIYLGRAETAEGLTVLVRLGSELRSVGLDESVNPDTLSAGDEVLLTGERNVVICKAQMSCFSCGEIATVSRLLEGSRCAVKLRDEESVVTASPALRAAGVKPGDEVRVERTLGVAFEKVERSNGEEFFLQETPQESFDSIGGLDRQIEEIQQMFALHRFNGEVVRRYQLKRKRSLLLYGPPGTGKTLLARALANWLAGMSKHKRCRFGCPKPGALKTMWYGETERKIREVFRIAREVDDPEVPTVLFFDEIDALGSMRGESIHRIDDHVLNAFMAELSGLEDRGNVVVVAATNLLSLLDTALVRGGRLGDLVLKIPRPNRRAAREIFCRHMPEEIPYACNGEGAPAARQAIIDSAVAQIFAANEDSELAHITFRDGKRRVVRASEMINGAEIAAIAQTAIERACAREVCKGAGGVQLADLLGGVCAFVEKSSRVLTPANCRNYLEDLPQDVDVVRVEPVKRKPANRYQYFNQVA